MGTKILILLACEIGAYILVAKERCARPRAGYHALVEMLSVIGAAIANARFQHPIRVFGYEGRFSLPAESRIRGSLKVGRCRQIGAPTGCCVPAIGKERGAK